MNIMNVMSTESMKCSECGYTTKKKHNFCPDCGCKLINVDSDSSSVETLKMVYVKKCKHCGVYSLSSKSNTKMCGNCLKKLPLKKEFSIPFFSFEEIIEKLKPEKSIVAEIDEKAIEDIYSKLDDCTKKKFLEKERMLFEKYGEGIVFNVNQRQKSRNIIHGSAVVAGTIGAIPIPFADAIPLSILQTSMLVSIANIYGEKDVQKDIFEGLTAAIIASMVGRQIVKLVPGAGIVVGTATAAALTEALGWFIVINLEQGKNIDEIVKEFKPDKVLEMLGSLKGNKES